MKRLDGKVAIVTGAAGGIGLAIAQLFAKEGAKVTATDIKFDLLQQETAKINAAGGDAIAINLDVTSEEGWKQTVQETIAKYGKIDILVNNAGIHLVKSVLDSTVSDWEKVNVINSTSAFIGTREVVPEIMKVGKGSIINVSSIAALLGGDMSDGGGAAYSASKGAMTSFTRHCAQAYAKNSIRVNSIHPGPILTPMAQESYDKQGIEPNFNEVPGGTSLPPYIGDPLDIAYGALYLASDESKFVTGIELVIDGGLTSR